MMKKLLGIVVLGLFLITPSQADDIGDFQIEGMSVGDSALDYFGKKLIEINKRDYYKNKKFTPVEIDNLKRYEIYDSVSFNYKTGDKNFKMHSLGGAIDYPNNIGDCYEKMDEIVADLSSILKKFSKSKKASKTGTIVKPNDTKKTTVYFTNELNDGYIAVVCYDYSEESGFTDHLRVSIIPKLIDDFLKIAYK